MSIISLSFRHSPLPHVIVYWSSLFMFCMCVSACVCVWCQCFEWKLFFSVKLHSFYIAVFFSRR